jgi:NAD(P)H-dependent nitrite reductase small subunit
MGRWFATQARCPHKGDAVLGRGIVGDSQGTPKVACPLHKRTFALDTGKCTSGEGADILTFPVQVQADVVYVQLPAIEQLEHATGCDETECESLKVASAAE